MAITRTKIVTLECDGPCGTKMQAEGVPSDWNTLKIEKASYENHEKPVKFRLVLCSKCSIKLTNLLQHFEFKLSANEQKKESK